MSYISTDYVPEMHLPPASLGEVSALSEWWQRRYRRTHDKDGTHNDELVAHAFAFCTLSGAGCVTVKQEGLDAGALPLRIGVGHVRITLALPMADWQALPWPLYRADSGDPYYGYEARDGGAAAKTSTVVDIKLVTKNGVLSDIDFTLAVFGVRL